MKKNNVLILTDHTNHSKENSLYALAQVMSRHPLTNKIDIASKGNASNRDFFLGDTNADLFVSGVNENFAFSEDGSFLSNGLTLAKLDNYDLIWLRMPPPLSKGFLVFVRELFCNQFVINNPDGIYETGSKEFLMNFQQCCPPMKICRSKADIIAFKNHFPIVLKPFRQYGGKGIVKIDGDKAWVGKSETSFDDFMNGLQDGNIAYLGVKYLKNVSQGDKRIVVVNGKVMGASLRLPPENFWICNTAMGGSSHMAEIDEQECAIIKAIDPVLSRMGIVMYGVDTLVGDDGTRVLSEINTTSIGGLMQIAKLRQQPLIEEAIDLIWQSYMEWKL